jgi:hypothetical protein
MSNVYCVWFFFVLCTLCCLFGDFLYDNLNRNQVSSNSNEYIWMSCWPACIEEMKLLLFVCTLCIWLVLWEKPCHFKNYVRFNDECKHLCYWYHYLHHVVYQISMSDLTMNIHTCVTINTTYTMLYVGSLCQI